MTFDMILALGVASPFVVYVVVRLATAAFFKSKQHYDNQSKGTPR